MSQSATPEKPGKRFMCCGGWVQSTGYCPHCGMHGPLASSTRTNRAGKHLPGCVCRRCIGSGSHKEDCLCRSCASKHATVDEHSTTDANSPFANLSFDDEE